MASTVQISNVNESPLSRRIFIIGGGIVGASLSHFISQEQTDREVIVIDKCWDELLGSTGHAPGFVGQLNESSVLTNLAKDTVSEYLKVPDGFNVVGGLELSSTHSGVETLYRRRDLALVAGLHAEILSPRDAASLAPDFINAASVKNGLHFSSDGTANAQTITSYYCQQAQFRGAKLVEAEVTGFDFKNGEITVIRSLAGDIQIHGSTVVLATGIWTSSLASDVPSPIPIVPVAHPYTFTPPRPYRSGTPYPFIRWLDHHVYARDHGDRDGMGSYDHSPLRLAAGQTAIGPWPSEFEMVLSEASSHLKNGKNFLVNGSSADMNKKRPFNGIFSVTPDNLPLAGKVSGISNLWLCAAIWVTTAAGTAKFITREILRDGDHATPEDEELRKALSPVRFQGIETSILENQALARYNDIYNREI
ncbi:hypothetical protein N7478_002670 [Penicillium angulare]|uniref:uncharacterized protein n=1 Tax=Penicillium angulare TaxID=116970 RepID=UPI00253FA8DB|nr:uncharacterized protein N7478_002670 [Penicillium angulare]KAJ5286984.1 hypothetical protein N7478_002670 [Penicillium angulare]